MAQSNEGAVSRSGASVKELRRALQLVLSIALLGASFSGVLTYRDYAVDTQQCTPLGPTDSIFGYPPCVYGLVMYSLIVLISAAALLHTRRSEV